MTQPNQRMMNLAARFERNAYRLTAALEHIARETAQHDGWPTSTLGDGGSRTSTTPDARIVAAAEARCALLGDREQLRDDLALWETMADTQDRMLDRILRTRLAPPPTTAQRCSGRIDPTCTRWASEHTLVSGHLDRTLCDDCARAACRSCGARPADRGRHVDGAAACEACYRRAVRAGQAA